LDKEGGQASKDQSRGEEGGCGHLAQRCMRLVWGAGTHVRNQDRPVAEACTSAHLVVPKAVYAVGALVGGANHWQVLELVVGKQLEHRKS
jgi:hypothetical protein